MREKNIVFTDDDDQHARMILRLRYARLTQGNFFRGIVNMYVNNDEDSMISVTSLKELEGNIKPKKSKRRNTSDKKVVSLDL